MHRHMQRFRSQHLGRLNSSARNKRKDESDIKRNYNKRSIKNYLRAEESCLLYNRNTSLPRGRIFILWVGGGVSKVIEVDVFPHSRVAIRDVT